MKINIACPQTGAMKVVEVIDERKLVNFYDKRMAQEVAVDFLGDEFKGYVMKITGGNDKQGFPMAQGILTNGRVRLLMKKGSPYYRPRRTGERRRKSIRGCIVGSDLSVLNLVVTKKGENDIPGLTDEAATRPLRLGPKRANNIRKMYGLSKHDDVRPFVVTRKFTTKKGAERVKRPKIQRLVTPLTLQRKRAIIAAKRIAQEKSAAEKTAYEALRVQRTKERRASQLAAKLRRSSRKSSKKEAATA